VSLAIVMAAGGCWLVAPLDDPASAGDAGTAGDADNSGDTGDAGAVPDGCPANEDPTLVAYYRFDEGNGEVIHDCSGHGNDAVLVTADASASWTTGHTGAGSAIAFNPALGTCVTMNNTKVLYQPSDFTVAAWIKVVEFDQNVGSAGYIVARRYAEDYGWQLGQYVPMVALFEIGDPAPGAPMSQIYVEASAALDYAWHYVAGVYQQGDGATPRLQQIYLDGSMSAEKNPALVYPDPNATLTVGCSDNASPLMHVDIFYGSIDEVRVYTRALDGPEIIQLAQIAQ
jgi:hypothetical protein